MEVQTNKFCRLKYKNRSYVRIYVIQFADILLELIFKGSMI